MTEKTDAEIKAMPEKEFRQMQKAARNHFMQLLVNGLELGPKAWERTTYGIRLIVDTTEMENDIAKLKSEGKGTDFPFTPAIELKTAAGFSGLAILAPGRVPLTFREKLRLWRYIKFIESRLDQAA